MNDFILELFNFLTEGMAPPKNCPEYKQAVQTFAQLEDQIQEQTGSALLRDYQLAEHALLGWESQEAFYLGLRFGVQFMLSVLPPQSSQTSAP